MDFHLKVAKSREPWLDAVASDYRVPRLSVFIVPAMFEGPVYVTVTFIAAICHPTSR
jgi:hypothetical protein